MAVSSCRTGVPFPRLVEYWLGELDSRTESRIDEHLLGCASCSEGLGQIVTLAGGIRTLFRQGLVHAFVTDAFVKQLVKHGVRVREYRVPRDGSVNCTVNPEDELLVARLEAPLAGVPRVDAIHSGDMPTSVFRDIPFDAESNEVLLLPKTAYVRTMPSHQHRIHLVAIEREGERVIGDYTFNHIRYAPRT
jgi:hypothetical protein